MCSILSSHSKRFLLCKQHHKSDHFRPSPPALLYAILYRTVGPITREVTLVLSTAVRILSVEGSCTRLSHVTALRARNIAGVVSCVALSSKVESIQSTPTTAQSLDHLHLRPHSSVPVFIGCPQRYCLQPLESRAQPCRLYHRIQRVDRRTIVPDLAPQQRKNPTHVHLTSRTRNENRHRPQNFH
ncbi:hypothetical protein CGGC5_v005120 [Colletotrichum fructicola Nara gc5]|uniref:Uncharacterized protein n=1 Tax=Colletotrichum fructicola (strain Nara gc5) TaxID=1213859 RepID=A0A7J6JCJ2_COLFN|nr:hypothetical protein CGGC5_v005120 [Colletotrichum fructicola Nara gc5]KAF5495759.1 hypothetical protein CGCF413_v008934 [Colletotrichum fructicola]